MGLVDYIIIALVVLILGGAGLYVYRSKKSEKKCIGCPQGGNCGAGNCKGCGYGNYGEKA